MFAAAIALACSTILHDDVALSVPHPRVLVFSKTGGFRHDSIPTGIETIKAIASEYDLQVTASEDASVFSKEGLSHYDVVVFLCTTGDVLSGNQETAFQEFIEQGGGYVGIHAAADTEYDWPFYGKTVGAYFKSHPAIQKAKVKIEDRSFAASYFLPEEWERTDEWYSYRANPRENVNVLASLDESSYQGGGMGDHPIAWWNEIGQGRSFYTGFGHTKESYGEPNFRRMIGEAIVWSAQGKRPDTAADVRFQSVDGWFIEKGTRGGQTEAVLRKNPEAHAGLTGAVAHGDALIHVEFRIPKGSNSGVYLQGRYEIQIFDSSGKSKEDMKFTDCGGIYAGNARTGGFAGKAPDWNAFAGPGKWNTYDIRFQAPRFKDGKKVENARVLEARLNGVVIHRNVELTGVTGGPIQNNEVAEGPLFFQGDHGNVEFRNVWLKPF